MRMGNCHRSMLLPTYSTCNSVAMLWLVVLQIKYVSKEGEETFTNIITLPTNLILIVIPIR